MDSGRGLRRCYYFRSVEYDLLQVVRGVFGCILHLGTLLPDIYYYNFEHGSSGHDAPG